MREGQIVGVVGEMKFRKVPRLLMDKSFSPPDSKAKSSGNHATNSQPSSQGPAAVAPMPKPTPQPVAPSNLPPSATNKQESLTMEPPGSSAAQASSHAAVTDTVDASSPESVATKTMGAESTVAVQPSAVDDGPMAGILELISTETDLEADELTDDRAFAEIGFGSLMSLVLSEKIENEVQVDVKSSVFIECPTVGAMRSWIAQHG